MNIVYLIQIVQIHHHNGGSNEVHQLRHQRDRQIASFRGAVGGQNNGRILLLHLRQQHRAVAVGIMGNLVAVLHRSRIGGGNAPGLRFFAAEDKGFAGLHPGGGVVEGDFGDG